MWHPRQVRFKSYRTRLVQVWYDLNLTRGCHRFYYLAPFTVFDSFSHHFLPCYCLFTFCVVWRINLLTIIPLSVINMICAWSWISLQTRKTSVLLFIHSFLFICLYVQFILIFMKYEFGSIYGALNDICQLFWNHLHINTVYCIVNLRSYIDSICCFFCYIFCFAGIDVSLKFLFGTLYFCFCSYCQLFLFYVFL